MGDYRNALLPRIERRSARVGVMGIGYVGAPLAIALVDAGFEVVGIDTDVDRIAALSGDDLPADVDDHGLRRARTTGRLTLTTSHRDAPALDIVVVCVPTPLSGGAPDLSHVLAATDAIARRLRPDTLVVLESTTYPGTTEDVVRPRLEESGLVAGQDFALAFSPERIDPGRTRSPGSIPKIVGGVTPSCTEVAAALYETFVDEVIVVARPREAELAKLIENTYRHVNVALVNEFAMVAHELGIDIWESIDAAATKPFGFEPFYPGVGIGGHCIAVDPVYLAWRIRELGRRPFRLVETAREVDRAMPVYIATRIAEMLAAAGRAIDGARVLALGVTYKPDVPDVRESRALEVLEFLAERGADVSFHDPYHEEIEVGGETISRAELDAAVASADVVAILTHHSTYDWNDVVAKSARVFDARGATVGIDDAKVERL